ncbi:lytic transglycosylase domain-containing protein [Parasphingorhabdus sp.]|uniref:lytic transglycosylase domain-containing protein n=1 Tax=Parasphingorhabdus sp. TaxID=2709688 RepID=UPI003265E944
MANVAAVGNVGHDRVTRAIANSAQRTGVDFNYLLGQAKIESGLDPHARARTSSATGLFQFIDQSWLGVIEKHGEKYGLDWARSAIGSNGKGRFNVADPALKKQILDLRKNPEIASLMAAEFASDNKDYLEGRLGKAAAPVDLYLAHFLGPAGAKKFLSQHSENPNGAAAPHMMRAASANRSIFYTKTGTPRSFEDIRQRFAAKLESHSAGAAAILPAGTGKDLPFQNTVQPADYVRLASQRAAQPAAASTSTYNESAHMAYMLLASLGATPR